jgi:pyrimidine deaminase RibD-like protein
VRATRKVPFQGVSSDIHTAWYSPAKGGRHEGPTRPLRFSAGTYLYPSMSYMARALELARAVEGSTSPNPPVGAVLVRDGVVVGEGNTQPPGGPHAEVIATRVAGELARDSTLFVTLEPCSHWGRTPPCADELIRVGVSSVHAAILDPNPRVRGQGLHLLQGHGVEVVVGEGEAQATELIAAHAQYSVVGRPLITLFESGSAAALSRLIRTSDVVLSNAGPLDSRLSRSIKAARSTLVKVGRTSIVVSDMRSDQVRALLGVRRLPVKVWDWPELLQELARREVTSVLLPDTGGPATSMLQLHLVDRVVVASRNDVPHGFALRHSTLDVRPPFVSYREDDGLSAM